MKNITDLMVVQIRLFQVDLIPFTQIMMKTCIDKVRNELAFQVIEQVPGMAGIAQLVFRKGEIKGDKGTIPINAITMEPRRIIMEVMSFSQEATKIYTKLITIIESALESDLATLKSPLLTVENTQCAVDLDFPLWSLYDEKFISFLKNKLEISANTDVADSSITPFSLDFEIKYDIKNETLKRSKIGITPKKMNISLRAGTTVDAKRYFISSPFDSDTHLSLIQELEASVEKGKKEKQK